MTMSPFGDDDAGFADQEETFAFDDDLRLTDDDQSSVAVQRVVATVDTTPITITSPEQVEALIADDVKQIHDKFADDVKKVRQQMFDITDTEYWVCVVFQSREQKNEFLEKSGWAAKDLGDKYIDGMLLAYTMDVELTSRIPPEAHIRVDRRLADLT